MPSSIKLTEPLDILVEYGYLDDNTPYHKALNIAVNDFSSDETLGGDFNRDYIEILQEEVRKELKLRRRKIDVSKFFNKTEETSVSNVNGNNKSLPKGEMGGAIIKVAESVDSIVETLKAEKKQDKKHFSFLRKMAERFKRRREENKLEFKIFDGLKKTVTTAVKPVRNALKDILDFIGEVLLGRVLFKILEWMGNKDNKEKLQSIIKFFKDTWPVLLTAYLLFGNSFGRMAVKLGVMVGKFAIKLTTKLIPKLLAGLAKLKAGSLLKGGLIAGAVVGAGVGIYQMGKMMNKDKEGENIADAQNQSSEKLQEEGMDAGDAEGLSQSVTTENIDRMTQGDTNIRSSNNMLQTGMDDPLGGGRFGFNTGGFVSPSVFGESNRDTVPAVLTPGEFVVTKGAVEKFGTDTLEGMNAAAASGSTPSAPNKPDPMTQEQFIEAATPGMQMFMEQQNAAVDENPEAFNGIKLELDRDGKMPNFGEFIYNQGEAEFNKGLEMLQNNEAVPPEIKEALIKKALFVKRQTLDDPNFKGEVAFDINKDIPGTAANRLFLRAQADTTSPAAMAGLSARDRALAMSRRRMNRGGLVQAFQDGGQVQKVQMGMGAAKRRMEANKITPIKKKKVTVAYAEEKNNMADKPNMEKSSQEIPSFSVTAMRSSQKIKVLGVSV